MVDSALTKVVRAVENFVAIYTQWTGSTVNTHILDNIAWISATCAIVIKCEVHSVYKTEYV